MIAVEVENLLKRFRRQTVQPYTTIKSALVDVFWRRRRSAEAETFEVLSGITFSVKQGQTLSIIGRNGSGKSTLLKVLAGIYRADHGRVRVHGRIGALPISVLASILSSADAKMSLSTVSFWAFSKKEVRQRFGRSYSLLA